jgi:hypothetical protein
MIQSLLPSFSEHLLLGSILFLVFFILFGIVFSGGEFVLFLRGMVRVAVSMVYSPLMYLRRATASILLFARGGERDYAASEQYLLNKFLLWWQAVVIILAMAWLSVAVVRTWYTFLAPEAVRTSLHEQREKLAEEQQQLTSATADVTRLDAEWVEKKQQLITVYRAQRERAMRDAETHNAAVVNGIRLTGNQLLINVLTTAQQYVRKNDNASVERLGRVRRDLDQWIANQYYVNEAGKSRLRLWSANWEAGAVARAELRQVSDASIRTGAQPEYAKAFALKADLEQRVPATQKSVADLETEAHFRWTEAFLTLVLIVVQFLFAVWVVGLLTEWLALMIRVADHVRALRRALAPDGLPLDVTGTSSIRGWEPLAPVTPPTAQAKG